MYETEINLYKLIKDVQRGFNYKDVILFRKWDPLGPGPSGP